MRILTVLILGLLIVCVVDGSVVPDEALTASLQNVWNENEFIIALSNIKIRKKSGTSNSIETLLAVKYKQKTKMVLILDRRTKRVILESLDEGGRRSAAHVNVDSLSVNTPLKSLIILVHQSGAPTRINSRVDVYVDCIYEGSIPLKKPFRDIAETKDPSIEVFRERKCRAKVYQSNINDALKKEKCPKNLIDIKQSSIFENTKQPDHTKINSTDSKGYDQKKKPIDRPDGTDDDDGIKNGSATGSDQNNNSTPSTGQHDTKRPRHRTNKKSPSKKDQYTHSSDREIAHKKTPRRPESNNKPDKYDLDGSFDLFSSGEIDNLDPGSLSSPFTLQPSTTGNYPKQLKKPHQLETESNESDQYGSKKPERSDETDGLDYPNESSLTSPYIKGSIQHPDKSHQDSRPDRSDGLDSYEFNKNLFPTSDKSDGFVSRDKLKRPGRSTSRPGVSDGFDGFDYPDSDVSLTTKRVPRRGDIVIQSLDEKICQTDDQIVKTLNELINATRKFWRELELNRQETQHLRQLIENCSACRTPIGE